MKKFLFKNLGQALENLKFKNVMSTWEKCVEKKLVSPKDCCEINCLMDEICHPEGSWKEGYKKKNIKDTRILIAGIVLFTLTLIKVSINFILFFSNN